MKTIIRTTEIKTASLRDLLATSSNVIVLRRAGVLLALIEGKTQTTVALDFGLPRSKVCALKSRFVAEESVRWVGLPSMGGRSKKLTEREQAEFVRDCVEKKKVPNRKYTVESLPTVVSISGITKMRITRAAGVVFPGGWLPKPREEGRRRPLKAPAVVPDCGERASASPTPTGRARKTKVKKAVTTTPSDESLKTELPRRADPPPITQLEFGW
ncbi:MAG: hypothetical protein ABJF10_06305 [Chthoniobacter sp.]|uniref:hypothetical protein n=1 Tax=Chthoniobacter sp. TaxID=2510640 RepID=UPI0032A2CD34